MHRDVKLGLALGILVIGFAAAFCFPRQPAAEVAMNPAAGLKLAAVDEEIRQERRRTFVGDELSPPEQPTPVIDADLPPLETAAMRALAAQRSAPDPIRPEVPAPMDADSPELMAQEPARTTVAETLVTEPAAEETFYVVESGDTLSGVASKMLGSSQKFQEIYEANRDILATPDALRIGMKLRIPQGAESVAKRQAGTSIPVAQKALELPPRNADGPIDRRGLFSPVRPMQARSGESVAR